MRLHLGLDLGSTETKVVAYDEAGRALAERAEGDQVTRSEAIRAAIRAYVA